MKKSGGQWPADKVERRKVAELVPYARNARTHSPEQVDQIAASIREWGWTVPVLIDEKGGIIAGHGRVLAAQKLGIADVPAMTAAGWSDSQKHAYVLADNKLALNAGWDTDLLKIELGELQDSDFDLSLIGFDADELKDIFGPGESDGTGEGNASLADRFGVPPFSVLNAREGWWQDRKRAWLALGIESELGRGDGADDHAIKAGRVGSGGLTAAVADKARARAKANAEPGGSKMPAADYSKSKVRGDGRGRAVK